jgi:hypothetical protein
MYLKPIINGALHKRNFCPDLGGKYTALNQRFLRGDMIIAV